MGLDAIQSCRSNLTTNRSSSITLNSSQIGTPDDHKSPPKWITDPIGRSKLGPAPSSNGTTTRVHSSRSVPTGHQTVPPTWITDPIHGLKSAPQSCKDPIKQITSISSSVGVNFDLLTPPIISEGVTLTDEYRGDPYMIFEYPGSSKVTIRFGIPSNCKNVTGATLYVGLNHCRTLSDGVVDMYLNNQTYRSGYADAPRWVFGLEQFAVPLSSLNMDTLNDFVITLNPNSPGDYWLSDVTLTIEGSDGTLLCPSVSSHMSEDNNTTGAYCQEVEVSDAYRGGYPYILFRQTNQANAVITFYMPQDVNGLESGTLTIALNHCSTNAKGTVNMYINGSVYRSKYLAPPSNFTMEYFTIPFSSLNLNDVNTFVILLSVDSPGQYWLSDAQLNFEAELPGVTYNNYETYVKNWILQNRKNIAELNNIPRDDMSAWQFIQQAPSWFYLPWTKASFGEIAVFIDTFIIGSRFPNVSLLQAVYDNYVIANQARDFHKELLHSDLARKNAMRHAYWTALMTRKYDGKFADELSDAHEDGHVDLTIEGPFDHVTDRINNAIGIELARNNPSSSCESLVEDAWNKSYLATAKNFRVVGQSQVADVYWQAPIYYLAQTYGVIPDFTDSEVSTLQKMGIDIPDLPPIHDEL